MIMSKHILIVESPAKSKTIKKYLGPGFEVLASYGHVRDLLPKEGAVDPVHHFAMHYQPIERNQKHVEHIQKALKRAESLYLATDPDREGEAIAWHLCELLEEQKALDGKKVYRVAFNEITKKAVQEAVAHPRDISISLVNAQQARRALDYLVGFNLSPLLWKKIRRGLSAGRVQSPALRLIAEREAEIRAFKTEEYWTIEADLVSDNQTFIARLIEYETQKLEQFSLTTEKRAHEVQSSLEKSAKSYLTVSKTERKQRKRQPAPPFITSTLQQEASRKLGFTAKRTMRTAQQLYEGIDTGEGATGLITYMRTDSVHIAVEAVAEQRAFIAEKYGEQALPKDPRFFKTKSKNAQEAHECIRPTIIDRTPEAVASTLSPDQLKLYELIWKRALAAQMNAALLDTVAIDLTCPLAIFRANGSTIRDPGFMVVYSEGKDEESSNGQEAQLPPLAEGAHVPLLAIRSLQHFTEPPPRYTEATLVKTLEEYGIGRPSTYANILSTLEDREYAFLEKKRFVPTDVGMIVNRFLTQHFTQYVDYDFTAKLEDQLDSIARGEQEWIPLMENFWTPFKNRVETIDETVQRKDVTQELLDEHCPKCQKPLAARLGKRGRFIGCTGYPDCDYTRNLPQNADGKATPEVIPDRKCEDCGGDLYIKQGRFGKFIGCSGYPKCKHIEPLEKPQDTGILCPLCRGGNLLKRKSRYGKIFYSCATYPKCTYAIWNEPVAEPCPKCQWPHLTLRTTKRKGSQKICPQKECGFVVEL